MQRKDVLGYVIFCTVTSNGTSHIAEIVRFVTELCAQNRQTDFSVDDKRCQWMRNKDSVKDFFKRCNNMYDFLYAVSSGYYPKSPGTCCDPRYTFNNRGKRFEFELYCDWILDTVDEIFVNFDQRERKNLTYIASKYNSLKTKLRTKISGLGPMSTQEFIQLSALLQIIPPQLAKIASCDGEGSDRRGPNILIRLCVDAAMEKRKAKGKSGLSEYDHDTDHDSDVNISESEVNEIFKCLHEELVNIVSSTGSHTRVTQDIVENTLCEMKRMWDVWKLTDEGKLARKTLSLMECLDQCFSASNIENLADKHPPKNLDVIYIYRYRHAGRHVQKLFRLDIASDKFLMHTHVFDKDKKSHSIEKTDAWQHMFWSKEDDSFTISQELKDEYSLTIGCRDGNLCSLCQNSLKRKGNTGSQGKLLRKATRMCRLNDTKNDVNCSIQKRDFVVNELPRIPKKEVDLNTLLERMEVKKNNKQQKRSRAKESSVGKAKRRTLDQSEINNCSKRSCKKRRRSRDCHDTMDQPKKGT